MSCSTILTLEVYTLPGGLCLFSALDLRPGPQTLQDLESSPFPVSHENRIFQRFDLEDLSESAGEQQILIIFAPDQVT